MNKRLRTGHGLLLFELILAIGFFMVFASIFLQIFLSAHRTSAESSALSRAVLTAESAAERFKAGLEPPLYYDENWNPVSEEQAFYRLAVDQSARQGVQTAQISVYAPGEEGEIFSLTVNRPEVIAP